MNHLSGRMEGLSGTLAGQRRIIFSFFLQIARILKVWIKKPINFISKTRENALECDGNYFRNLVSENKIPN